MHPVKEVSITMASPILIRPTRLFAKFNIGLCLVFIFDKHTFANLRAAMGCFPHVPMHPAEATESLFKPSSGNGFVFMADLQQRANVEKVLRVMRWFQPAGTVILAGGCSFSPYVTRFGKGVAPFRWFGTCV
jgi:hypothetical protein